MIYGTKVYMKKYKKNSFVVPPIIRPEIKDLKTNDGNFVLVYLTKKDNRILRVLIDIIGFFSGLKRPTCTNSTSEPFNRFVRNFSL